jgi:protein-disulfide isomerase
LIRPSVRFNSARVATVAALLVLSLSAIKVVAQQQVPQAPPQEPSGPVPTAPPVFPKPDPSNFTAASPSKEAVNAFLQTSWGYDDARMWQVQAILKTPAEGVSKVIVLVGDKTGKQKASALGFFVLPDGKHIIAGDDVLTFGEHPYQESRATLQQKADGPFKGSALKDLELVEFADFQCPHCKDAQANMDKLAVDFPKARIVFQNYPLTKIHPSATIAAGYGVCVAKMGGSSAYFQYAAAVYEGQDGLNTPDGATLTLNSATSKAGQDPAKVAACAATPETKAVVDNSVKLAQDLNINQTPVLMVNGRMIPMGGVPYETIKQIVQFQAKLDGAVQ